jgi:predicted unusual protein kinase regulating ubiquinone biosynthesis (AarF/ABC1/UbiB family)
MLRLEGEGGGPPRLCLIDFGLVAEVPAEARAALASGMVHLTECNWPRWIDTLVELDVLDEATLDRQPPTFTRTHAHTHTHSLNHTHTHTLTS